MRVQNCVGQHFSFHLRLQQPCTWESHGESGVRFTATTDNSSVCAQLFRTLGGGNLSRELQSNGGKGLQTATSCWDIETGNVWAREVWKAPVKTSVITVLLLDSQCFCCSNTNKASFILPSLLIWSPDSQKKERKRKLWLLKSGLKERSTSHFTQTRQKWTYLLAIENEWVSVIVGAFAFYLAKLPAGNRSSAHHKPLPMWQ